MRISDWSSDVCSSDLSTVSGLAITNTISGGTGYGVEADGAAGATIAGNSVTVTNGGISPTAILVLNSANVLVSGNTVTATGVGARGIDFDTADNATVSGNTIASDSTGLRVHNGSRGVTVSDYVFGPIGGFVSALGRSER